MKRHMYKFIFEIITKISCLGYTCIPLDITKVKFLLFTAHEYSLGNIYRVYAHCVLTSRGGKKQKLLLKTTKSHCKYIVPRGRVILAKPVLCFFEWKSQLFPVKFIDNTGNMERTLEYSKTTRIKRGGGRFLKNAYTGIEHSLY